MSQYKTTAGIQITYDGNKAALIMENLRALVLTIRAGNLFAGFHISPSLLLISSLLEIDGIHDEDLIATLSFSAGIDIQGDEDPNLQSFFEALGRRSQSYLSRPFQEFHLVFPFNYKKEKLPEKEFSLGKLVFGVTSWDDINNKYDIASLSNEIHKYIGYPHNPVYWNEQSTPLLLKIYGRNAEEVFRRGEKAYDVLISSINFLLDGISYQLSRPSPVAKVRPAVGYGVFLPTGNLDCHYVDIGFLNLQTLCDEDLNITRLQSLITIAQSHSDIDRRLVQALTAYNEGLQATQWDISFLCFWRVFEIIAFGDRKDYHMNSVVRRICLLLKADKKTEDFLNLCSSQRNNLVHRGVFPSEGQPQATTLKIFSNMSLSKFEMLIQTYRSEQMIEQYFELAGSSTDKLEEQKSIIENILKERKQ